MVGQVGNENMSAADWIEYNIDRIRNGSFTFRSFGQRDVKEQVYQKLIKEVEDGTANDNIINALVEYQIDQINFKRITIDDVSPLLKDKVQAKLNK